MSTAPFTSVLATDIQGFLDMKRSLGYKYDVEEYLLHVFDRYWNESNGSNPIITMDSLTEWVKQRTTECKSTQSQRISIVRQFTLYMNGIDKVSYVPMDKIRCPRRPAVHILSSDEIKALFKEIDEYRPSRPTVETARMANEYRVIFRLILSTGLRRKEAVSIKLQDLNMKDQSITVNNAKGRKDRVVCFSSDMSDILKEYLLYLQDVLDEESSWLFPSVLESEHLSSGGLAIRFRAFWNKTSYSKKCEKAPTIHALRHTFVVFRMNEWIEKGIEFKAMMPYLSRHLGHKSPDETFYYYHQVLDAFRIIHQKDTLAPTVLPEVRVR